MDKEVSLLSWIGSIDWCNCNLILCDGYKGAYLGPSAIVPVVSFIVDICVLHLAVSSVLDIERFQNQTGV